MADRPADHRTFNERVYPIVTALKELGHKTIMPDHPDANSDAYVHWLDATAEQLQKVVEAEKPEPVDTAGSSLEQEHLQLRCVVAGNIGRLANLIGYPFGGTDDVGQQLDFMVDDVIEIVEKIVTRNEQLTKQLEGSQGDVKQAEPIAKPHNPANPAHRQTVETEMVPKVGKASDRAATPEDAKQLREHAPVASARPQPPTSPAPGLDLTRRPPGRPMSGPWR